MVILLSDIIDNKKTRIARNTYHIMIKGLVEQYITITYKHTHTYNIIAPRHMKQMLTN